jgi:hypothetical protein
MSVLRKPASRPAGSLNDPRSTGGAASRAPLRDILGLKGTKAG